MYFVTIELKNSTKYDGEEILKRRTYTVPTEKEAKLNYEALVKAAKKIVEGN